MPSLTDVDVVTRNPDQVSADLNGEAVVLSLPAGVYFGMNLVGARVWELVGEPRQVETVCQTIASEFDVDPAQCREDVMTFLTQLLAEGLIDVTAKDG